MYSIIARMYELYIQTDETFIQYPRIEDYIFNAYWLANCPWKLKYVIHNGRIVHYIFNVELIRDN
jgi:hypothetical protein